MEKLTGEKDGSRHRTNSKSLKSCYVSRHLLPGWSAGHRQFIVSHSHHKILDTFLEVLSTQINLNPSKQNTSCIHLRIISICNDSQEKLGEESNIWIQLWEIREKNLRFSPSQSNQVNIFKGKMASGDYLVSESLTEGFVCSLSQRTECSIMSLKNEMSSGGINGW